MEICLLRYVAHVVRPAKLEGSLVALVADFKREQGEPSTEDYEWARRALGLSKRQSENPD
jgi:hypothetical protein